jgi:glycosyltransferase involved in cell wall biosynthesis
MMISILIPCRNEEKYLGQCLNTVFAFDEVPGDYEVLVIIYLE